MEDIKDGIKLEGNLIVEHFDPSGKLFSTQVIPNTVTTAGKQLWADQAQTTPTKTAITKMEIGEGTGGTTALNALIATWGTQTLTSKTASGAIVTYIATFTAGGTKTVTEAGLFNTDGSPVMANYSSALSQLMNLNDTLQITWNTTVG